jgi:SMC interacting uncharacterized protein involved in chromosome segregation
MKHTELEDGDQLVTRTELREVVVSIHEEILAIHNDILEIKKEILSLRTDLQFQISDIRETIRNKWWVPILVALIAMAANTIVAILFLHS